MARFMRSPGRRHTAAPTAALLALGASVAALAQEPPVCPALGSLPEVDPEAIARANAGADIEITSDRATIGVDGDATLQGNVRVRQGDRELDAEDVAYDAERNAFRVEGGVEYRDPIVRARGSGGSYSATGGAHFSDAEFELPARPARGAAERIELAPNGLVQLDDVSFTTCPVTDQDWRLRAQHITLDTRTRTGTGRGARVDFLGVPLVYLPWLSFPLGNQRKTGFLFPSVGNSSRSGFELSVPFYWNIAPNYDLTLEPVLYGKRGVKGAARFRYLTRRHEGSLAVDYLPSDRLFVDEDRSLVGIVHRTDLSRGWRLTVDAQNVSDDFYFEDFGQGTSGTSIPFVERSIALSYRDEHWSLLAEAQDFQTIDRTLPETDLPYARAPRLLAGGEWTLPAYPAVQYGFDGELVRWERSIGVEGWRFDFEPRLVLDLAAPGFFLRPAASLRWIGYSLERRASGEPESPTRSIPQASLDTGLVFERLVGSNATERLTLEPRLLYLYTPFREQSDLPLFDTSLPDLNLVQLFSLNRFVGGDRVADANQLSVGLTTRLLDASDGTQFLSATLGQTVYFDTPSVRLPEETLEDREQSDLIAQLTLTAYRDWNVDFGLQWNPEARTNERSQLQLQYRPSGERVVNLAYRQQRDRLEQAEFSGAWPVGERWNAFARIVHSLREDKTLEQFAGFEYRACCWRLRAVGRRFVSSRTGERDTGIYVQLELSGLASVGVPADAFLEEAIRGYSPARTSP
jgi:LPS-assembly protein